MADSIRRFDSKTNRTANSIPDSKEKNDSQVPIVNIQVRSALDKGLQLSIHGSNRLDEWRFMGAIQCV